MQNKRGELTKLLRCYLPVLLTAVGESDAVSQESRVSFKALSMDVSSQISLGERESGYKTEIALIFGKEIYSSFLYFPSLSLPTIPPLSSNLNWHMQKKVISQFTQLQHPWTCRDESSLTV